MTNSIKVLKRISLVAFILLTHIFCVSQKNSEIIQKYIKKAPQSYVEIRDSLAIKPDVKVIDYLPKNHSIKGDVNYTNQIQKALDESEIILMPNFPLLVDERGLNIQSNTTLLFKNNSRLILKPNAQEHYSILRIENQTNVNIYFANIKGDKYDHLNTKGEWGMGIRIIGSKNVTLYAPKISHTWGDGIYIGGLGKVSSESIKILYPNINESRRNGISITSGRNVLVKGGIIGNTGGTAPQSGLDIEPNRPTSTINNISIEDVLTYKNKGDGIMISLSPLTYTKNKLENIGETNIDIVNHVDIKSYCGFRINGRAKDKKRYRDIKLNGTINVNNSTWIDNAYPIRFTPKPDRKLEYGFNPSVKIDNMIILDSEEKRVKKHSAQLNKINKMIELL